MSADRKYEVNGFLSSANGKRYKIFDLQKVCLLVMPEHQLGGVPFTVPNFAADCMTYEPPKPKSQPDVWIPQSAWNEMQIRLGDWPGTEAIERAIQSLHGKPSEWVRKADTAEEGAK